MSGLETTVEKFGKDLGNLVYEFVEISPGQRRMQVEFFAHFEADQARGNYGLPTFIRAQPFRQFGVELQLEQWEEWGGTLTPEQQGSELALHLETTIIQNYRRQCLEVERMISEIDANGWTYEDMPEI